MSSFLVSVSNLGMPIAYERNYFACQSREQHGELLFSAVGLSAAVTVAVGLLVWMVMGLSPTTFGAELAAQPLMVGGVFLTQAITRQKEYFLVNLRCRGLAKLHVRYSLDQVVLGTALSAVLVYGGMGLLGYVLGPLVAGGLVLMRLHIRFLRELPAGWSNRELRDLLGISLPLLPRLLANGAVKDLDKVVLGALTATGSVGLYVIAQRLAGGLDAVFGAVRHVFGRRVYEEMFRHPDGDPGTIGQLLTPFALFSAWLCALALLFAQEVVAILLSPEFIGVAPIAGLLFLRAGFGFFGRVPQLQFAKKTWVISMVSIANLGLWFPLMLVGARAFGGAGAAGAVLLTGLATEAAFLRFGQRAYHIRYQWAQLLAAGLSLILVFGYSAWMRAMEVSLAVSLGADLVLAVILGWVIWFHGRR